MSDLSHSQHNVVFAPQPYNDALPIVFLSGTVRSPPLSWFAYLTSFLRLPTDADVPSDARVPNWRDEITSALSRLPVTVLNPHRLDWDSSWRTHIDFLPFRQQVEWELDGLAAADVIAVYFESHTEAPITMLELGLFARDPAKKCIVGVSDGYAKRGNVQVLCARFDIQQVDSKEELAEAVHQRLGALCAART